MSNNNSQQSYTVLARKYRPARFEDMIGQDVLIQTLGNAFETGRIGHGFLLSGVRGIGKTTTARILAKCLNCLSVEQPTIQPCGVCENCVQIAAGKHIDVLEMDAASRTGIDDIREIIDSVQYRPVSARYKVYIIDEVHMLSKSAFNGLLKTLEEPPEHCKFIFATTEIHKIPPTIQSRCQRYDLKRVSYAMLADYLAKICEKESVTASLDALKMIAKAAEGSVRDSLSLLDQAISYSNSQITEDITKNMLGLSGFEIILQLFDGLLQGNIAKLLENLQQAFEKGVQPQSLLAELLDFIAAMTRYKITNKEDDIFQNGQFEDNIKTISQSISIAALSRLWQVGIQGYKEVGYAPNVTQAVEMIFIRMAYAAMLPLNDDIIQAIKKKQ